MRFTLRRQHLAMALLALVVVVDVIGTHNALAKSSLGFNDFLSRWEGARAYIIDGASPYGPQASLNIQRRIYGGPAPEGKDPSLFAYPFYTVFLVAPLVYLDYAWASAIWMVFLEVLLIGLLWMTLDLLNWRPRPWIFSLLIVAALFSYPPARGLLLGQPSHVVIFAQMLTVWALAKGRDELAGAALALSTIKPQMGYLFMPFILLWGLRDQRWRFLVSFAGTLAAAVLISFALLPSWLAEWAQAAFNYTTYTLNWSPTYMIFSYYLGLPSFVEGFANLCLYGLAVWAAFEVIVRGHHERFLWTLTLILTITNLAAPRHGSAHFAIFVVISLAFYCQVIVELHPRQGMWWITALILAVIALPWAHFLLTVEGNAEHVSVNIPLPVLAFVALLATHRLWWKMPSVLPFRRAGGAAAVHALQNQLSA